MLQVEALVAATETIATKTIEGSSAADYNVKRAFNNKGSDNDNFAFGNTKEEKGKEQDDNEMKKESDLDAMIRGELSAEDTITEESEYKGGQQTTVKNIWMSMNRMQETTPKIKMVKITQYSQPKKMDLHCGI